MPASSAAVPPNRHASWIYGTEGIGKTTFGAQAPKPIFVPTEDGLDEIACDKFPLAASINEVLAALEELRPRQC